MSGRGSKKQKPALTPEIAVKETPFDIPCQARMDELMFILRKNSKALRKFRGVTKVDIGYHWKNGRMTGKLAIRVHVIKKKPLTELSGSEILPEEIDGIPVDVIQSRIGLHRMSRYDPLVGGIGIRNVNMSGTGTLGAVVFDAQGLYPVALTTRHVVAGSTRGEAIGDQVNQPGTRLPGDAIGSVARSSRMYDCALVLLNGRRKVSTSVIGFPGGIKGVTHPVPGMRVAKSGLASGTTRGMIEGVSEKEFTIVPVPGHIGDEISMEGDSGSLWIEKESHAAVGLHYGGEYSSLPEDERAWAKRISCVAGVLKIKMCRKTFLNPVPSCAPSIIAGKNRFLLGWSKPGSGRVQFLHSGDGTKFSVRVIPGIKSSSPVALAFFRNRFTVAWSEMTEGQLCIRFSDDGLRWDTRTSTGEYSQFSPALAASSDLLLLSWIDPATHRICIKQSFDGLHWQNRSTFDVPAFSAPAMVAFNGRVHLAWSGERNHLHIMTTGDDFSMVSHQPTRFTTSSQPCFHIHANRLFLAWTGGTDQRLNIMESSDGQNFNRHLLLREISPDRPALATSGDEMVWCWKSSDRRPGISLLSYNL